MVLREVLIHRNLCPGTITVLLLEPIGLRCEVTSHTINLVRLGVVCANDNLSRIINIG